MVWSNNLKYNKITIVHSTCNLGFTCRLTATRKFKEYTKMSKTMGNMDLDIEASYN